MSERVYEMLWDCGYCGTKKLLGKSQRFCPKCGAPQDPERRYFPPEGEEIAVEDHVYVGADRVCQACKSAMSARAQHCTQCGAPMEGAAAARLVADDRRRGGRAAATPSAKGQRGLGEYLMAALGVMTLLGAGLYVASFYERDVQGRVMGVSWRRSIAVESFEMRRDSIWCDSLAPGLTPVGKRREVRGHTRVEDGQECTTRREDRGDGTFAQRQDCTPRYRDEPVYDEMCLVDSLRWGEVRKVTASGSGLTPAPHWPELKLRAGDCRGCEREGRHEASYRVVLRVDERPLMCEVGENEFPAFKPGSAWTFKQGAVLGLPDCKTLKPAS